MPVPSRLSPSTVLPPLLTLQVRAPISPGQRHRSWVPPAIPTRAEGQPRVGPPARECGPSRAWEKSGCRHRECWESRNVWGVHKHQSTRNWGAMREVCPLPQRPGKKLYAPSTGSSKAICSDSSQSAGCVHGAWLPELVGTGSRREAVTWQMSPSRRGLGYRRNTPVPARNWEGGGAAAEGSREPRAPLCQSGHGAPALPHPLWPALFPPHPSLEHRVPGQGLREAQPRCRMRGGRCGREGEGREGGGRTK